MVELSVEDFQAYFEAMHGHEPFPWQRRLLSRVVKEGRWPSLLDLPTGTGKTAAIDVALFHLALDAGRPHAERRAPRRIELVVDRRTVVDQGFERARKVARKLTGAGDGVLGRVAARLRSLSQAGTPLLVAQLRGGMPRDDAWARWPDQPVVAVSTVDQVGSRLLFRGYGVSEGMRPIHAGLLGNDALILLDEVHLSEPFRQTLRAVANYRRWAEAPLPDRWQVVELSATPGEPAEDKERLEAEDRAHRVLSERLSASKPVETPEPVKVAGGEAQRCRAFAEECAAQALRLAGRGRAVAVVVNRVATAREVERRLRERLGKELSPDAKLFLVTGRMRPLDRDDLDADLRTHVAAGRPPAPGAPPVIVVSTQCIEAGADFDFDALVTECAALDALRQRFGRVDRLGQRRDGRGVVLVRADVAKDASDPIYGNALAKTWEWLRESPRDFGIDAMDPLLRELEARTEETEDGRPNGLVARLTRKRRAPVMLPAHLDFWVQTKPTPEPDPDVALWLHGVGESPQPEVQIVWRADVSEALLRAARPGPDPASQRRAKAPREALLRRVQVCPPVALEAVSVPLYAARAWLRGDEPSDVADVAADTRSPKEREREEGGRAAKRERPALRWQAEDSDVVGPDDLRPGDTLIVPGSYGGLAPRDAGGKDRGTWDPTCEDVVPDLGDRARWQQTRRPVVRLHAALVSQVWTRAPASPSEVDDPDAADRDAAMEALHGLAELAAAEVVSGLSWLPETREAFREKGRNRRPEIVRIEALTFEDDHGRAHTEPGYLALVARKTLLTKVAGELAGGDITTEGEQGSHTGVEVPLQTHLDGVAELARDLAASCGLPAPIVQSIHAAASWHDAGKVDPRFQRLLRGGAEAFGEPLAKSRIVAENRAAQQRAQERSGYPRGARHELSSVALLQQAHPSPLTPDLDADLVLHLVASHHGWCRPFAPVVLDERPEDLAFERAGASAQTRGAHGLERLDSGVAERFWRLVARYGWFGLAWLEAILRLADHRQSEREVERAGKEDA